MSSACKCKIGSNLDSFVVFPRFGWWPNYSNFLFFYRFQHISSLQNQQKYHSNYTSTKQNDEYMNKNGKGCSQQTIYCRYFLNTSPHNQEMSISFWKKLLYTPTGEGVLPPLMLLACEPIWEVYFDLTGSIQEMGQLLVDEVKICQKQEERGWRTHPSPKSNE